MYGRGGHACSPIPAKSAKPIYQLIPVIQELHPPLQQRTTSRRPWPPVYRRDSRCQDSLSATFLSGMMHGLQRGSNPVPKQFQPPATILLVCTEYGDALQVASFLRGAVLLSAPRATYPERPNHGLHRYFSLCPAAP